MKKLLIIMLLFSGISLYSNTRENLVALDIVLELIKNSPRIINLFSGDITYFKRTYCNEKLRPEHESYVKSIISEMAPGANIEIYKLNANGLRDFGHNNAFAFFDVIAIDENFFNKFTEAERRFVIGHELTHILKRHNYTSRNMLLVSIIAQIIAYKIIEEYKISEYKNGKVKELLRISLAAALASSLYLIRQKISRMMEFEADFGSVILGTRPKQKVIDGGIKFFSRHKTNKQKKAGKIIKFLTSLTSSHPSREERINYLKQIATQY